MSCLFRTRDLFSSRCLAKKVRMAVLAFLVLIPETAFAERLITSISSSRVLISSSFSGTELVLFGSIERDGASVSRSGSYDVVVMIKGPASLTTVREKQRIGPIWINAAQRKYSDLPGYLAIHSSRPMSDVTSDPLRERFQLGLNDLVAARGGPALAVLEPQRFHSALIRLRTADGLFQASDKGVVFLAPNLFRTTITLPATAPLGNYEATVMVFSDGAPLATERSDFEVLKTGFEARVALAANSRSFLYGLITVFLAIGFGWLANFVFRRD
jgi:uncharacterized protein (TIGR02186 family)